MTADNEATRAIAAKGLTQRQVAEQMGTNETYLSRLITGRCPWTRRTAFLFAAMTDFMPVIPPKRLPAAGRYTMMLNAKRDLRGTTSLNIDRFLFTQDGSNGVVGVKGLPMTDKRRQELGLRRDVRRKVKARNVGFRR